MCCYWKVSEKTQFFKNMSFALKLLRKMISTSNQNTEFHDLFGKKMAEVFWDVSC